MKQKDGTKRFTNALTTHNSVVMIIIIKRE